MQSDVTVTQLLAFLNGEGEIEGRWFGDKDERGAAFWWRRYLPALADAQGEPVAWAYVNCDGECEEISWGASYLATMAGDPGITPLYAHPPAQDVAALVEAMDRVMPIRVHDGPDYAEVYFADGTTHSTQAMTMNPADWQAIADAYAALRAHFERTDHE